MKIIGIGGTTGSGKDTVGQMLVERRKWLFISVTDILRAEARRRSLPLTRKNLRDISAEWRREYGPAVLIDKALEQFKSEKARHRSGLALASLRHPAEAKRIHELGGEVVWTDARPHIRYERITGRQRGAEDKVSFDEFLAEEQAQMSHAGDEHTVNLSAVKDLADVVLINNGRGIEAFKDTAEKALKSIID